MTALDRKLVRDLMRMKMQCIAIMLVLACGVATFVMSVSMHSSLVRLQDQYYRDYRFAHVFAYVKRAPNALARQIGEIPGVMQVEARIVADVILDVPGLIEPATARLISRPQHSGPTLNDIHLRRGRWLEPDRRGEVIVSERFADAHELVPGDSVTAIINGRLRELTVVGVALSPEFIYEIREGELLPDPMRFGVFWVNEPELAAAFDLDGAFNNVALQLMPGANEAEVIARLDDLTMRYGGRGAFSRADQTSHRFVSGELDQLQALAVILPVIFLAVSAFLFNMVISRMIQTQREQIAALRAFGYSRREIAWHYIKFVGIIVLGSVILGMVIGGRLGRGLTNLYAEFFNFPSLDFFVDFRTLAPAILISALAAGFGTASALRKAARLVPAEAMRPEPPTEFRPTFAERMGFQRLLSQTARMVLRNIERQPLKSSLTTLGLSLSLAIMVMGSFNLDVTDFLIDFDFNRTQRQDATVSFYEPTPRRALAELSRMPGVLHAEPFRAVPVRLRHEHLTERVAIVGIESQRDLLQLIDQTGRTLPLPDEGLLMSAKLADLLKLNVGDAVQLEVLEGQRPVLETPVAVLLEDYIGLSVYMNIRTLNRMVREQDAVSGAYIAFDESQTDALFTAMKHTPGVATVVVKQAAIDMFRDTIAENIHRMTLFNIVFATIIAFGVIYNSARITLAERDRELATLRVMGFTRGEISLILLGELAVFTIVAIPIGLLIGTGFAMVAVEAMQTEDIRFPLVINPSTYGYSVIVILLAALFSGLVVRQRLDRLDLIGVLKSRM